MLTLKLKPPKILISNQNQINKLLLPDVDLEAATH